METLQLLILLICSLNLAWCSHDLSSYQFKAILNTEAEGGLYELYWNFDNDAETISFAVRVQTSGWVGFGLSPNGQMPDSDVVIGWVTADGETMFHVSSISIHKAVFLPSLVPRLFCGREKSLVHTACACV